MHVFLLCKYARVDPFMPYPWEGLFFMKKYMVWLISVIMAVSMTACSNTQKKDTKDQAQVTTAAKENGAQTETAKTTSQKDKKNEKKKDKKKASKKKSQKNKKNSKKTNSKTTKKKKTTTKTTAKKKTTKKKNTKEKTTKTKNTKDKTKTTTADSRNESTTQEAKNEATEAKKEQSCEFLISCKTVLSNKSALQSNYQVPSGGKIYEKTMKFEEGDTVMDVLKRTGVDIDVSKGYVAGIDGLYEFDCGKSSGWMYRVNGKFPNYMAGKCKLHDGDKVEWLYTCVRGDL